MDRESNLYAWKGGDSRQCHMSAYKDIKLINQYEAGDMNQNNSSGKNSKKTRERYISTSDNKV